MYTVIVRECRAAGLPRPVEIDVSPIAEFRWNIGYNKKSPSPDDRLYARFGRPEPATSQPEVKLFSAWKKLLKDGFHVLYIEGFVNSRVTFKDLVKVRFDEKTCQPKEFTQLVQNIGDVR